MAEATGEEVDRARSIVNSLMVDESPTRPELEGVSILDLETDTSELINDVAFLENLELQIPCLQVENVGPVAYSLTELDSMYPSSRALRFAAYAFRPTEF